MSKFLLAHTQLRADFLDHTLEVLLINGHRTVLPSPGCIWTSKVLALSTQIKMVLII